MASERIEKLLAMQQKAEAQKRKAEQQHPLCCFICIMQFIVEFAAKQQRCIGAGTMLLHITQPHPTIFAEWRGFKGHEIRKVVVAHECVIKVVVMVVNFRRQHVHCVPRFLVVSVIKYFLQLSE